MEELSVETELDVIAITRKPNDKDYLISVLVSLDESIESAIKFFGNEADNLIKFIYDTKGKNPYFEIFVDYNPSKNDSQQSQQIDLRLIKALADLKIGLVVTIHQTIEEPE